MGKALIAAGGNIDDAFALALIRNTKYDLCIAADSGMEFYFRSSVRPDVIIGDFDSARAEVLSFYENNSDVEIVRLNPVKDDTDTEAAIRLAIDRGADSINIIGATGERIDHVLANISLLGIGLRAGVDIALIDRNNRIRMICDRLEIKREEQFGKYVSVIPFAGDAGRVSLTGFKYQLNEAVIPHFSSLGVSNEITDECGIIKSGGDVLLVIESLDSL